MTEHKVTMESTLKVLLEQKKYSTLKDILVTMNPSDVAELFEEIADERLPRLFRLLPKEQAAETFVEMQPEQQELLIRGFSDAELRAVVEELYVDDAVDLVEEMPANVVKRILAQADPEMRKDINNLLQYPENSAGSIMTTEYVSLRPQMTDQKTEQSHRTYPYQNRLHLHPAEGPKDRSPLRLFSFSRKMKTLFLCGAFQPAFFL